MMLLTQFVNYLFFKKNHRYWYNCIFIFILCFICVMRQLKILKLGCSSFLFVFLAELNKYNVKSFFLSF